MQFQRRMSQCMPPYCSSWLQLKLLDTIHKAALRFAHNSSERWTSPGTWGMIKWKVPWEFLVPPMHHSLGTSKAHNPETPTTGTDKKTPNETHSPLPKEREKGSQAWREDAFQLNPPSSRLAHGRKQCPSVSTHWVLWRLQGKVCSVPSQIPAITPLYALNSGKLVHRTSLLVFLDCYLSQSMIFFFQ